MRGYSLGVRGGGLGWFMGGGRVGVRDIFIKSPRGGI